MEQANGIALPCAMIWHIRRIDAPLELHGTIPGPATGLGFLLGFKPSFIAETEMCANDSERPASGQHHMLRQVLPLSLSAPLARMMAFTRHHRAIFVCLLSATCSYLRALDPHGRFTRRLALGSVVDDAFSTPASLSSSSISRFVHHGQNRMESLDCMNAATNVVCNEPHDGMRHDRSQSDVPMYFSPAVVSGSLLLLGVQCTAQRQHRLSTVRR